MDGKGHACAVRLVMLSAAENQKNKERKQNSINRQNMPCTNPKAKYMHCKFIFYLNLHPKHGK
jgi:ornithine carbamoyltransferase